MSHSSTPNLPNLPPPPDPSPNDPSRNRDEWIAVLVALLAMGGIFFWVFGKTDRPGGLILGQFSSSTNIEDAPSLSPLLLGSSPDISVEVSPSPTASDSTRFKPNLPVAAPRTGAVSGFGTVFGGAQQTQTATEAPSEEEAVEAPSESETPSDSQTQETPTATETPVASPEATEEGKTDETTTPEAEQPKDTDEPAAATTEQSQKPRFGIPIPGFGTKPDGTETPGATEETPTEVTASPEAEETPTATEETPTEATASPEAEETPTAEQPEASEEQTAEATASPEAKQPDDTASPASEEQATASKPKKPGFGISIPGFGSKPSGTETPAASSAEFSDVPDDFWAKDYVQYFVERDIVTGDEDGTFKPEKPMSRAAVAAQIEDAFEFETTEPEKALQFEDVGQDYLAKSAIDSTTQTGFLNGYPGQVFRPDQSMTRAEVLVALVSGLDLKPPANPEETLKVYQDADQIPEWAVEKVAAATEAGLVVNYPNTDTFNPNGPATRAEVSAMIYQALVQAGKADAQPSEYIVDPKK